MSAMERSTHLRKLEVEEFARAGRSGETDPDRAPIGLELDGEAEKRTAPAFIRDPARDVVEVARIEAERVAVRQIALLARPGTQLL